MTKQNEEFIEKIDSFEGNEEPEPEKPWPQVGDNYWTWLPLSGVFGCRFDDDKAYAKFFDFGLAFKTKEEADLSFRQHKLYAQMKKRAKEFNGDWVPDWETGKQYKHGIKLKYAKVYVATLAYYQEFVFGIAVHKELSAKALLEEFGEEILAVYGK